MRTLLCTLAIGALCLQETSLNAQVSVIGELSQDHQARPGEKYEGSIMVRNDSNEPQEAKVYQTDYLFYANGTNNYGEPGSHPRSNAKWVAYSPSFVTIPPQGTMTINFAVSVPDSTSLRLNGTYWSMLMIEGIPKGSPESSGANAKRKAEMGIMQTIRYGIQIATHLANTGSRKVEFKEFKLLPKEGGRILQFDVENTGELGIRPEVYVELFSAQGLSLGKFAGLRYRIYPGTSVRESVDLSSVKPGTYKALVVVDAGGDDIFAAQYNLKF